MTTTFGSPLSAAASGGARCLGYDERAHRPIRNAHPSLMYIDIDIDSKRRGWKHPASNFGHIHPATSDPDFGSLDSRTSRGGHLNLSCRR